MALRSVCIFCGSNAGAGDGYVDAARRTGRAIAERGLTVVYGGAAVGLMGAVADAALEVGGSVVGVMPKALIEREIAHKGLTELHEVTSMHQRKAMMADRSDAFLALPGGVGTLEETFEAWTWGQLGHHSKPVGLLNVAGFFDALLRFLDHQCEERFMRKEHRDMLLVDDVPERLIEAFERYRAPEITKWIGRGER